MMFHGWAMPQALGWVVKVGACFHLLNDVSNDSNNSNNNNNR